MTNTPAQKNSPADVKKTDAEQKDNKSAMPGAKPSDQKDGNKSAQDSKQSEQNAKPSDKKDEASEGNKDDKKTGTR